MNYDWDFRFLWTVRLAIVQGAVLTLVVSIVSFSLGTLLGCLLAWFYSKKWFGSFLLLNDAVRAVPPLALLFLAYYFPYKQILGIAPPSITVCTIMAFTVSQASYTADVVRSAILALPEHIVVSASALGLSRSTILWHLLVPDVTRQVLPAHLAFFIGIIRLVSVASVLGLTDVVFVVRGAGQQAFRSLEGWVVIALVYIIIVTPFTVLSRALERSRWLLRRP